MSDTPETDQAERESIAAYIESYGPDAVFPYDGYDHARKLERERDEAIKIARKAMGTVMQIYGHAQFCNECQSFEIADSCRSQMHDMDRINSLLTESKRNENES